MALCTTLVVVGCNKPRKRVLTKEQSTAIKAAILKEAPTPKIPIGAILDNKLELIGADISPPTVKVGGSFKAVYYWRVLDNLPPGNWMIFVHLDGSKRSNHDHQGVNELLPLSKWKKGQIIRDEQTITVANDFQNGTARLFVGVFDEAAWRERRQNVRLQVVNRDKLKTPVGADNRIEVARITLTGSSAKPGAKRPTRGANAKRTKRNYTAVHSGGAAVQIDGKLTDAAWRRARPTAPFVSPNGGRADVKQLTQARLTWDDKQLYVAFTVRDEDIFSDRTGRDAKLWERDVVEIYLDPGADGRDYVELQISPNGDIFDAHFSTRRKPNWPEAAKRLNIAGMTAKVALTGTANKRDDVDRQWTVEVGIPWAQLPGVSGPPKENETWAMNLYRIDAGTPKKATSHLAWTAAGGDFHNLPGFGKIRFTRKAQPTARATGLTTRPPRGGAAASRRAANPALLKNLPKRLGAGAARTAPGSVKKAPAKPGPVKAAAPAKPAPAAKRAPAAKPASK